MDHPLAGVRTKVDRAKENIINLEHECIAFLDKHYRLALEGEYDASTARFLISYPEVPKPLVRFAVLTGEILYLLRSSLDNLVGQLIRLRNPTHSLRGVSFPICSDPRKHKTTDCGKLKGIPAEAATAIMLLQSCHGRSGPDPLHKLSVLNRLNNWDKHRQLVLLSGLMAPKSWDIQVTAKGIRGFEVHLPSFGRPIFLNPQARTQLGYVQLLLAGSSTSPEVAYLKAKQKYDVHIEIVAFENGDSKPLIPFLQDMERLVFRIVRNSSQFF